MQVVDKLPSVLVGSLHHITSFVGGYIAPSIQFSSGMMGVTDDLPEDQCQKYYDMSSESWSEVCKLQGKYARLEDMRYAFALLCFTLLCFALLCFTPFSFSYTPSPDFFLFHLFFGYHIP